MQFFFFDCTECLNVSFVGEIHKTSLALLLNFFNKSNLNPFQRNSFANFLGNLKKFFSDVNPINFFQKNRTLIHRYYRLHLKIYDVWVLLNYSIFFKIICNIGCLK